MKTIIKNVGVLDIRTSTEEAVSNIEKVENAGVVLYNQRTAPYLSQMNIGNMGTSIDVSEEYKLITGQLSVTSEFLAGISEPQSFFVAGQLLITDDVKKESFDSAIQSLIIAGQVLCPETLMPSVQQKIKNISGHIKSFKSGARLLTGRVEFNSQFLSSLGANEDVFVIGRLNMTAPIPAQQLENWKGSISVVGKVLVCEECAGFLNSRIADRLSARIEIIPQEYYYVKSDMQYDSVSIRQIKNPRIYTSAVIKFENDITPELLKDKISNIRSMGTIICPDSLRETIADMLELPETIVISYSDDFICVDAEYFLTLSELECRTDKISFLVYGSLDIADDIPAELLMSKISRMDNYGEILVPSALYGAVQTKLRSRKGILSDKGRSADSNFNIIENVGYFSI